MTLKIPTTVYIEMVHAAQKTAPLEACGLLGGNNRQVSRFYLLTNADASPEHFSMIPEEQFAAAKDMRKRGINILAIWHSHPSTPARMSAEDAKLAFTPDVAYVIVSLAQGANPECRAFAVNEGIPQSIEVVIANE